MSSRHHCTHTRYMTNISAYRSLRASEVALPMSFQPLSAPIYDCLFLSAEPQTFYPRHSFFLSLLWCISPPRRSLSKEPRRGHRRECYKRKWQFRWENGNSEEAMANTPPPHPLAPWTYESLYTRVHTPLAQTSTKIFCGLSIFFSYLLATSAGWCDFQKDASDETARKIFGPWFTIVFCDVS